MSEDGGSKEQPKMGWKDYLALFIALLQTVALPLVILIAVILGILFALSLFK